MRSQVFFRDVTNFSVVRPDGSNLFPNVAMAFGRTHAEKTQEALSVLMNYPKIDSVVVLRDPQQRSDIPLESLGRLCVAQKMKIDAKPEDILRSSENTAGVIASHLMNRRKVAHLEDDVLFQNDVKTVSNFFRTSAVHSLPSGEYSVMESTMTYYPNFGRGTLPDSFINCHIDDEGTFDVRRIDCTLGSGTILFNANDFKIETLHNNGRTQFLPVMMSGSTSCLVLPEGASVFIREPSPKMLEAGKGPSVHAHGTGPIDGSKEERLTFKHDLILS